MATAGLGTLVADMVLRSAGFIREMNRAQQATASETAKIRRHMRQVELASRSVERSFQQLRTVAVTIGAALAVRQFTQFTRAALDSAAAIQDVADKVGLTTTQLQQLRFAAIQSGVAQNTLDLAMQRFSRRVGEAAVGSGELVKTLKAYGIAVRDSEGRTRTNIDILRDLADVIKNAGSEQERLRIAFKAFDSEGAALVNVLKEGSAGLQAFMDQAVAVGAVMDKELIAKAKVASDNLAVLQTVFANSFRVGIIESFADSLKLTEEGLLAARDAGEKFGQLVGAAMRAVAEAATFVARNLREIVAVAAALVAMKLAAVIGALAVEFLKLLKLLLEFVKLQKLSAFLALLQGGLLKMALAAAAATAAWVLLGDKVDAALAPIEEALGALGGGLPAALDESAAKLSDFIEELDRTNRGLKLTAEATLIGEDAVYDLTTAMQIHEALLSQKLIPSTMTLTEAIAFASSTTNEQVRAIFELIRSNREYERQIAQTTKAQQESARASEEQSRELARQQEEQARIMAQPFENAIEGIQGAFTDFFQQVFEGGVRNFGDLAKAIKAIFIRLAAEIAALMVFRPILGGLVGGTSLGSGLGVAGSAGGLFGGGFSIGNTFALSGIGRALGLSTPTTLGGIGGFSSLTSAGQFVAGGLNAAPFGLLGSLGAGLFGLGGGVGGTVGGIGGSLLGGALGSLGAIGGPVGAIAGGFLGSALGGLFGGKPSVGPTVGAVIGSDLRVRETSTDNKATREQAQQFAQEMAQALAALVGATGGTLTRVFNVERSQRNGLQVNLGGRERDFGDDLVGAIRFGLGGNIAGLGRNTAAAFNRSPARDFEQFISDLSLGRLIDELRLGLTDAERAIRDVTKGWDEQIKRARELGLSTRELTRERNKELSALRAQVELERKLPRLQAKQSVLQQALTAGQSISDFLNAQLLGDTSSLSPAQRLAEAQKQFQGLLGQVRGGDLRQVGALTQSAQTLLGIGRDQFASSINFSNLESFVRSSLQSVGADITSSANIADRINEVARELSAEQVDQQKAMNAAINALRREVRLMSDRLAAA